MQQSPIRSKRGPAKKVHDILKTRLVNWALFKVTLVEVSAPTLKNILTLIHVAIFLLLFSPLITSIFREKRREMARKEVGGIGQCKGGREREMRLLHWTATHGEEGRGKWGEEEGRKEGSPFEEKERNCKLGGWRKREREEGGWMGKEGERGSGGSPPSDQWEKKRGMGRMREKERKREREAMQMKMGQYVTTPTSHFSFSSIFTWHRTYNKKNCYVQGLPPNFGPFF